MEIDYFCLNQKLLYFRPAGIRLGSKRVNTIFKFLVVNKGFFIFIQLFIADKCFCLWDRHVQLAV